MPSKSANVKNEKQYDSADEAGRESAGRHRRAGPTEPSAGSGRQ